MDASELEARIRGFLRDELRVEDNEIDSNTPLLTSGLIDSAGLVRLAALIERETTITIPDQDINADNFDSIERIQAYLRGKGVG